MEKNRLHLQSISDSLFNKSWRLKSKRLQLCASCNRKIIFKIMNSDIVQLNVGGIKYTTSLKTIKS